MKKITLTLFFASIVWSYIFGQHIMEVIPGDREVTIQTLLHNNNVHVPEPNSLHVYDGETLTEIDYPLVDGVQLRSPFRGNIFVYRDAVHLILDRDPSRRFVARYNDGAFTLTLIPGLLNSDVVVFRGKMYMVVEVPLDVPKLVSFDGTTFRDVTALPPCPFFALHATNENIYINGLFTEGPYYLARYNGTSFTNIPFGGPMEPIERILEDDDSDDCYLIADNVVLYFDGTAASVQLFFSEDPATHVMGASLFGDDFYFQVSNDVATELYRFTGTVITTVSPPAGTQFLRPLPQDNLIAYRDALYVPVTVGGMPYVYRYDGINWESIFSPGIVSDRLQISARPGKLVFYQAYQSEFAYEYNGYGFDSFTTPAGVDHFAQQMLTARCYHVWLGSNYDSEASAWRFTLMKETFDSLCVSSGSTPVIPGNIAEYDRLFIGNHARERDWCWTGIDIDWEWPICFPPCAPSQMRTSLTDKSGKTAWQKIFDKPISASIPLNDSEPYTLSVDIEKDKKFGNVLTLDKELVNNGIEDLSLDFYPKEGYFFLDVETDNKQQVPLTMNLRNTKGESLWEKKLTAPFHDVIYDRIDKAGDYLQFSLQTPGKSNVTYYPNPFTDKLNVIIAKGSDPVSLSVMNMNGKMVLQKEFVDAGDYSIELSGQKSGLYILTIKEGVNTRRALIELKE